MTTADFSGNDLLNEITLKHVADMVETNNFATFIRAAANGQQDVLVRLYQIAPDHFSQMLKEKDYLGFRTASLNGHLHVINLFFALEDKLKSAMVKAYDYGAFHWAAAKNHLEVINRLLSVPEMFAWAEVHDLFYGEKYIHPLVSDQLLNWKEAQHLFKEANPNKIFDFSNAEESRFAFYIARNLIRRGTAELLEDLRFLLSIPGFSQLVHTEVTKDKSNELLLLAYTVGNQDAALLLLALPDVMALAEENNFYVDDKRGQFELSKLAQRVRSKETSISSHPFGFFAAQKENVNSSDMDENQEIKP